tara:strand:- start:487 stop:687 length:201 start_codon:yes stop_codon:yes gene_type:complete
MTFLEWEIYYRFELEEANKAVEEFLATAVGILNEEHVDAIKKLLEVSKHVVDNGFLDEDTNKWKVE